MPRFAISPGRWVGLLAALVLIAASLQAARAYTRFLSEHRQLWYSSQHDRNEHYLYALQIATSLRSANVPGFVGHFARAAVWPPLHGLVCGGVLAAGGLDYRLAVLPSLLAWVGSAVLAYLLTRRLLPAGGQWAGLVPVAYLLASPLHHGFAVDVMLESTGALITLWCLYWYVRVVQDGALGAWRALALGLTASLLHKYNYYVLIAVALVAAELTARWRLYLDHACALARRIDGRGLARRELRHPLTWLFVLTLLVALGIWLRGPRPFVLAGLSVNIYPPGNILQAAYVVLCARLALAFYPWRRSLAGLDERPRQIVLWHVVPAALFMLLPKHVGSFLWYVSPANKFEHQTGSFLEGVRFYIGLAPEHYHPGVWSAAVAVVLFAVALACCRRLRPGASAVLWLGILAAVLTARHPNHQIRYLHSWIAAAWVATGAGTAAWLTFVPQRRRRVFAVGAAGLAIAIVLAHAPGIVRARRSSVGGPVAQVPTLLDVADAVLAESDRADRLGLLPAVPVQGLARWAVLQRHGKADVVEYHRHGFGPCGEANRSAFRNWLQTTRCDTLIYLEPAGWEFSTFEAGETRPFVELADLIRGQGRFRLVRQQEFTRQRCRMLVYRRDESDALAGR